MRSLTVAPSTFHAFRPKYSWHSAETTNQELMSVASPTSRKFTQNVIMWNPMSNTKMENKLITREIIIVINRFGLLKQ